jgi:hypothetical protein
MLFAEQLPPQRQRLAEEGLGLGEMTLGTQDIGHAFIRGGDAEVLLSRQLAPGFHDLPRQ